jgi:transposase-like protein
MGAARQGRKAASQPRPASRKRLVGVAGSILEGIDEILTVTRLGLPKELRRSLACTNIIENAMSTVRRVCRNVKRWRSASMAMRWTAVCTENQILQYW